MYFNFENYESKGGSKEHFLNSFTKNYDLENDTYERVQKGIENFNKENNTSFDLYDYLKFNSKKIKFKKKEPLQEQGKEDLNEDLAEQKEPLQDENLEENKSFKRKHDLSKESEILNDTSLLSDVKNSLKRGAETLSDVVGLDELVNFDSDIKSKADENIKDLIKQGASYEDLNELEKNYLANKESRENVRDATNIFSKEKSIKGLATLYGTNEEEKAKKAFAEMKSTQEALSKEKFEDLNEQEKELIDKERGAVESFFVNLRDDEYKQKSFDELKEKYEAKNFISKDVLRDLEFLKNIHQSKSVSSLILSADEKEKKDYENSVLNIALNAGFDDVLVDEKEGKMYFEKEGQKYLVNEGFFDNFTNTLLANTGSITGGLIGAAKGASSAKSPQSALAKSIAYSALGSGIGASADVLATNYLLDRKNRFDEMLHHALEESALSAVGDALVLGAKPLLKTAKDSIKDFGKILDYTPLVSTTKNFPTQNIKAAQDLVEKSVDLNTQKELDEFYKAYGGRSDLADSKALDALVDTFKAKFGEDSFISKNTQKLNDILNLNSLSAKQNALFEAIRADESGFLLPYVKEVASYDVRAFKNLKNILNLSTQRLENSLKNMNLNKGDIKNILDDLEKGTKEDYNEVMNEILAKTYDDRFKVVLGGGEAEEQRQILSLKTDLKDEDFFKQRDKIIKDLKANKGEVINSYTNESAILSNAGIKKMSSDKAIAKSVDNGFSKMEHLQAVANIKELFRNSKKLISKGDVKNSDNNLIINRYVSDLNVNDKEARALLTLKEYNENGKRFYSLELENLEPLSSTKRGVNGDKGSFFNGDRDTPSFSAQNNYTKFRKNLQEQGLLDEEALKFLNYVENTIYNPKGVTFTQLNNALKNINSFYKQSTNPGFKEHIKNAAQSFLRDDIKKGINEIFKQDKNLYAKASKLYETSLAEYAQMKELLKASAYKKARNESTTQVKALDELIKYSKGQGKDGLNNLDFLRAKLDEKDVAILEMNLLNRLYEKSLANTDESLRVFDSTSFLNELSSLQNNAFKSKEANDFIELVKGFDKLFKNDAKIALELAPVTAKKEGSALATSAKGAVLQKIVKSGFDLVFRNLGQNVLFGSFKDQIQGAALRYHLKKALQKSDTISEFNTSFKDRLKKGQFNSKTRELSKDFLNDVENFSKNLDDEVLKDTKLSDESLKELDNEALQSTKLENTTQEVKEVAEIAPSATASQSLKSTITHNLSPQEIKEYISKWDLSNPSKDDKLLITKVEGEELELLKKEFDFKGNYELAREIDAQHIAHALNRHTQDKNQANININIDEILEHYPNITKNYDKRVFTKDNTIIYAKQINGHFIVIEEVLTGKNKLRFDTAWKQNGKLNEEVLFKNAKAFPNTEKQHKVATATQNLDQIQGGTSHNQSLSDNIKPQTAGVEPATTTSNMKQSSTESISLEDKTNYTTNSHNVSKAQAKKQEVLNKIKSKEHKEYLRLQTKLEESKQLEAQALKELEPIKQRILAQNKAREFYAQALEKLDISAFGYQIKDELKPIFSTIKKARRGQEHYTERLFSYPLKKLQGKSLTFNEKEFPLYENALTLKRSHSIDKNPKLIKERVALRKAIESHLDIKPIKEFGTNYAEHYRDGANAIAKILSEAKDYEARKEAGKLTEAELEQGSFKGQVAGAFYKEGLGDIDLVWGDPSFGLAHILERRTQDFIKEGLSETEAKTKAREFVESIPEIIENGKIRKEKTRAFIEFNDKQSVIALDYKGDDSRKWLLTAYKNYDDAPSPAYSHQDRHNINTSSETRIDGDIEKEKEPSISTDSFTKGETLPLNSKDNSSTNAIKLQANAHIGTGLASGTLAGLETDENGNIVGFDPQKFALGFLGGSAGSLAVSKGFKLLKEKPELKEAIKKELADTLAQGFENASKKYPMLDMLKPIKLNIMQSEKGRIAQANHILNKLEQKEAKGLANVTYNGKNASLVYKDLENIDEAILYAKGNRYKGAKHIRIEHLTDSSKEGYVRDKELVNLGKDIREFLKYNEPFIDKNGARLYEWENKEGVRFRVVINDIADMDSNPTTATEEIITFYSDRNLKERMKFKNFTLDYDKDFFVRNNGKEVYLSTLYNFLHNTQKKKDLGISDDLTYSYVFLDKDLSQGDFKIINHDIYLSSKDKDLKTLPKAFKELLESTETKDYKLDFVIKNASKKLKISPRKAKDLLEWHKNSSPITKDKDGLPKVFYHGSEVKDLQEFEVDRSSYGYFFSSIKDEAKSYQDNDGDFIQSFLKIKNPFKADEIHINSLQDLQKINDFLGLKLKVDKNTFKSFALMKEYINEIKDRAKQYNLTISETNGAYTTFIKGKKIINDHLTNPKNPIIQEAFKNFEHIGYRDASHNLLGFVRNDFDLALFAMDRSRNYIGEYEIGVKNLKDILKQKGYDGIKFNEFQYSVFDSNQIKHINNKGSYIDESGNITNTKPKDTQTEHRYFNEKSPNIYYSNQHIGTGLASGTLAGLETDENGNIVGFDPQKFALGFLGGAVGSKGIATIYKHKVAQDYALKSIRSIQENYKELSQQNPVLFAKILSNINPRNFLKSKKEVKALSEEVFNKELKAKIQESLAKQEVELMPQSAFSNIDEFKGLFDEVQQNGNRMQGLIKTPYKDIHINIKYAYNHFRHNTYNTNRDNIKGGFFETFKNPLFVVEQTREGSTKPSVYFYKPFYDENKKLLNLFGISVDDKGKLDFKTYYLDKIGNRLESILNDKNLLIRYVKE